jgi:hypothetical protein
MHLQVSIVYTFQKTQRGYLHTSRHSEPPREQEANLQLYVLVYINMPLIVQALGSTEASNEKQPSLFLLGCNKSFRVAKKHCQLVSVPVPLQHLLELKSHTGLILQ